MTAIEDARAASREARNHAEHFPLSEGDAVRVTRLADVLDALIAEHERLTTERDDLRSRMGKALTALARELRTVPGRPSVRRRG